MAMSLSWIDVRGRIPSARRYSATAFSMFAEIPLVEPPAVIRRKVIRRRRFGVPDPFVSR